MEKTRYATVRGNGLTREGLSRYLPANYAVIGARTEGDSPNETIFIVAGEDYAGWTMDDYVIPRLASGLIWAKELVAK
jgi:hypothetical protein